MNRTNTSLPIVAGGNASRKENIIADEESRNQEWDKENDSQNTLVSESEIWWNKTGGFKQNRVETRRREREEGIYVQDIREYVRKHEESKRMGQVLKEINVKKGNNYKYREQVVAYFVEMVAKYGYKRETLYLAITIYDKYMLENQAENQKEVQQIGIACLFIAGKYVQYIPPRLKRINICSKESHIILRQHQILTELNFNLTNYTSYNHLEHFLQEHKLSRNGTNFSYFLSDFTLFNYRLFALTEPQALACGILYIICQLSRCQFPSQICPFKLSCIQTISNNIMIVFKHYCQKHLKLIEKINKDIKKNEFYQFK